mmetsp:Transcript_85690/g.207608  ORF Transcript_85690/g.207608 Transcript_85690/m.207608 type:complete len:374 (-) Transcript_85690:161-1282(-)
MGLLKAQYCIQSIACLSQHELLPTILLQHYTAANQPALVPVALVDSAIRPLDDALTMPDVLLVATLVTNAVGPDHLAVSLHLASLPLADVLAARGEVVCPLPVVFVLHELALVGRPGAGGVLPDAVLAALQEVALVAGPVGVRLHALAGLVVLLPLALVCGPTRVHVLALPAPLALVPLALVARTVRRLEDAVAVGLAVDEVALVALAVGALQQVLLLGGLCQRCDGGRLALVLDVQPHPLLVREDGIELVLDLLCGRFGVILAELLPIPVLPCTCLVLLVQRPIPHREGVHQSPLHNLLLGPLQHLCGLLVAMPQHSFYDRLLCVLVALRSLHLLVLTVQEYRILSSVILTASSANELDPLSLTPWHEGQDE